MREIQDSFPVGSIMQKRYTVVDLLGQGTSGAVYLVRDKRNQQNPFVLKEVLHVFRKGRYIFPFDAKTLRRLNHPALPHIYDVFNSEKHDRSYMLMDYIEGSNLEAVRQQLPEKRASLPQAITLISPIIGAVSYLHQQQPPLIHSNIKPSNIIVSKTSSTPILVDFGGLKEFGADVLMNTPHQSTLNYQAPEQFSRRAGTRADIYALGAVLYTLLTGTIPVAASHRLALLELKEPDPLLPMNQIVPSIPPTVAHAIHRAMSIHSHDRFSTVEQFWEALWQMIYTLPAVTQVQALIAIAPPEEEIEADTDPTDRQPPGPMFTASIEENKEPDAHPEVPQITEPKGIIPEVGVHIFKINSTFEAEPAPVFTSPEPPFTPAFLPPRPKERKSSVKTSLQEQLPVHRFKKVRRPLLVFLSLALFVSISLSSGLWLYSAGFYHFPAANPTVAGQFQATPHSTGITAPNGSATPDPASTPYPKVAGQYDGMIYNIADNTTTKLSLTGIQQQQGTIIGYFSGLLRSGRFQGTINTDRHVYFVTTGDVGKVPISFDGAMQSDGTLEGSYCILNQARQCGSYGLWSASPTSSKQ